MKNYLVILVIGLLSPYCLGQFGPRQIIDDQAQLITMVRAGDLDGDGDLDLAASLAFRIVWYEHLDGMGNFAPPVVIGSGLAQTFSVHIADLNGDDHLDILGTSFDNSTLFWFENLDGLGNFGTLQLISNSVLGAFDVITADLDGDNDLDVIINADGDNTVSWFENTNGAGSFGPEQVINNINNNGRSVLAGDIDGDGDLDVVNSSSGSVTIAWCENQDGLGNFGSPNIVAGAAPAVNEVFLIDIDDDTDLDIVSATNGDDRIAWHENLDGLGTFGPQQIISNDADFALSVYASDLDNDGDPDVLSASSIDEKIAWYENLDGLGSFGPQQILETEAAGSRSVIAADIDNDGDNDVLGTLRIDDTLTWYENLTILGTEEKALEGLRLTPNPATDRVIISSNNSFIDTIGLYTIQGQLMGFFEVLAKEFTIEVASFSPGVYLLEIERNGMRMVEKLVIGD